MDASDLDLARSAAGGDERAFHQLIDRHAPSLFRSALSLTRNRADAEDLLQETMVAAFRGMKKFEGRSSVRTWLVTILTRNAFKALHRSRHRRATLSIEAMNEKSGEQVDADAAIVRQGTATSVETRLDVMQALQGMSPAHREVLVLREIEGMSYEEIAAVLGLPRGTVESRLFRARAEFRERFGSAG